MPYVLPSFNLAVNIWRGGVGPPPVGLPQVVTVGNLAMGRRVTMQVALPGVNYVLIGLLLPPLTDVRPPQGFGAGDIVEVPAGTGRYYTVRSVDDAGKGFANEHRVAFLLSAGLMPFPMP